MKVKGTVRVAALALIVVAAWSGIAGAAKVKNGGFESGDFSGGWISKHSSAGQWAVTVGMTKRLAAEPDPIAGDHSAFTFQDDPSRMALLRKVELSKRHTHTLSFKLAYGSEADFKARNDLNFTNSNQQLRVDVLRAGASSYSLDSGDVLKTVLLTRKDDPDSLDTKTFTSSLSKYAGKTVKLRFAVVAGEGPLSVELDSVKVKSKPKH